MKKGQSAAKRILVTGGAGFIGSHLVDRLLGSAVAPEVTCVDNFDPFYDPARKEKNLRAALSNPRFRLVRADICDKDALAKVFAEAKPQVVVHLAARAGVRPSLINPAAYHRTNVDGTLHVLECSRDAGVEKVVFGSSSSVYGVSSKLPFAETDPLHCPISPYAVTKITAENLCAIFHRLYGISTVSLRFFTVYGPRQRPEMAIAKFVRSIQKGETIDVYGNGSSLRDYTYVDDIVAGICAAIEKPIACEVINLGNARAVPLKNLLDVLQKETKTKAVLRRMPMQAGDVPVTFASLAKAKKILGYKPKVTIREGIRRYVAWLTQAQ